ncbi:MAG: hypothetical protein KGY99_00975 [Phycisphaerae bacterium]|nr:hypothetical protein [Phycisphaerae bacterium]
MEYCCIFHANLNYAYLLPEQYEFVIRESYELILDTMREEFGHMKFVFEASGFTIDRIAELCPDVLAKLKAAIDSGQCEPMGSPYAHLMMPNFPAEDDAWALTFSQEAYERHLGRRLVSGWNPECGWRSYVPQTFADTGFKQITLDFDAYALSTRDAVREVEYNPDKHACYGLDLPWYEIDGTERALRFPFKDVVPGLNGFARTDRICQPALRWLMGMYDFDAYIEPIRKHSAEIDADHQGALIVFAEDAEYIGTSGWFFLKYHNQPERVFEKMPDAREKLCHFLRAIEQAGGTLVTFDHICNDLPPLDEQYYCEDDLAWHRAWSTAWRETPESLEFDPQIDVLRERIHKAEQSAHADAERQKIRQAWFHLTCAANSDGRWPPPPDKVHPFNKQWVTGHLDDCHKVLSELGV